MKATDFAALLGPELLSSLEKKGYSELTPVQAAVLDPALADRDLRISSQTGSGKTLAIGFSLRHLVQPSTKTAAGIATPRVLVVTPTRELAKQVESELGWLYAARQVRVVSVTGGANYRDERRGLAGDPGIVVGTPGRLLDHLQRGSIDPRQVKAVVLDEADRMLDLGFREDLDAILAFAPAERRIHLVSATFAREVLALADRAQKNPAHVQGTPLGTAHSDIDHVLYVVAPSERVNALVNLLLAEPGAQTLVFARTRADVAGVTSELREAGFKVDSLSGEMEQAQRNRALSAFRRGELHALVATDVAARGIDVQDIARVVQLEPATDSDGYTHRSGRTGRAGRKGTSATLVAPKAVPRATVLLKRLGVKYRTLPVPTAADIRKARAERVFLELTGDEPNERPQDEAVVALAQRIVDTGQATRALLRLLAEARTGTAGEPREITPYHAQSSAKREPYTRRPERGAAHDARPAFRGRGPDAPPAEREAFRSRSPSAPAPEREVFRGRPPSAPPAGRAAFRGPNLSESGRSAWRGPSADESGRSGAAAGRWEAFRVSWGEQHGADARRLLAMLCRRGGIRGADIGAIRVAPTFSVVEIATPVALTFERATRDPDPRDPRVFIQRERVGKSVRNGAHGAPRDVASRPDA
jgi:ATP-dependent RNA helicase DeaD